MDWSTFTPNMLATLMFVVQGEQILLIRKKRGLGAGKMNGPGGKIEPGETAMDAALRETHEELGILPLDAVELGLLQFQFVDGLAIRCHVYRASQYTGTPTETEEATPHWTNLADIPYHEMWEDDHHWLPLLLENKRFSAYFEFDGERMLSKQVTVFEN